MKKLLCFLAIVSSFSFVFSIELPVGGDYIFRLSNPEV